ncbi:MAG TPA: DmsC/YnfH family molybdoenzyme membrane anchor subunit [Mizugakiibacter sp.]
MRPALSIVAFTVLAGAGYGVWIWLGLLLALHAYPPGRHAALLPLALGFILVSAGLVASLLHLGQPQRAWRALSQWRTSWLSREGLAALLTYLPALALAARARGDETALAVRLAGALLAFGALTTVTCTARIYTSLPPIPAWRDRRVLPLFHVHALLSGGLWFATCAQFAVRSTAGVALAFAWLLAVVLLLAANLKRAYWRALDTAPAPPDTGGVSGLATLGAVRAFEGPTTETSYVAREMAFALARKHAGRLRRIAAVLTYALPFLLLCVAALEMTLRAWALPSAAIACTLGLLVERWLFFAEAKHVAAAYFP